MPQETEILDGVVNSTNDEMASNTAVTLYDSNYWCDRLHPDFQFIARMPQMNLDSWFKTTLFSTVTKIIPLPRIPPNITKENVAGIGVYFSTKSDSRKKRVPAAVLWIHGGGRIVGSPYGHIETSSCLKICEDLNVPVLAAYYRLAPKHPFPAALDDLTKAYIWLSSHLESRRTDEDQDEQIRIALAGDSAGGGLAAELCQKLLDESDGTGRPTPLPVAQLLIYPMLDDRTCVDTQYDCLPPHLLWNNKSNMYGWSSYLGQKNKPGDDTLPDYASASRRKDLSNLPPAYIVCGDLDLFLGECRDYAQRLREHGVHVEYEEIIGGVHGMLSIGDGKDPVIKLWKSFQSFGEKYLSLADEC
ncbi:hypothetical protein HJC23_007738 [Cyclotella cryptica]|uniref:Alpha/beta hydrolase fold-3 domain-containing protein n=1 Tax=Cyclotella cryptica TaxID=29204 RepID=A0ABD3R0C6_9STRA|eukprot:CCRYP_000005-RA/>CCRYP_000005-RA protein AED:0.00 eAED:0.00 QI:49/-1/1/1/-1/1/1/1376/358